MIKRLAFFLVSLVVSLVVSAVVTWFAYVRPLRDRWGIVPDETERTCRATTWCPTRPWSRRGASPSMRRPPRSGRGWCRWATAGAAGTATTRWTTMRASADRIMPELQGLSVGDLMPTWPGGGFRVADMEAEQSMSLYLDSQMVADAAAGRPMSTRTPRRPRPGSRSRAAWAARRCPSSGRAGASCSSPSTTAHTPASSSACGRGRRSPTRCTRSPCRCSASGVFLMTRKQLLGIKERVERAASSGPHGRRRLTPRSDADGDGLPRRALS